VVLEKGKNRGKKKTKEKEDNTHMTLGFGEDKGERKKTKVLAVY
jgi:hypothetical protein